MHQPSETPSHTNSSSNSPWLLTSPPHSPPPSRFGPPCALLSRIVLGLHTPRRSIHALMKKGRTGKCLLLLPHILSLSLLSHMHAVISSFPTLLVRPPHIPISAVSPQGQRHHLSHAAGSGGNIVRTWLPLQERSPLGTFQPGYPHLPSFAFSWPRSRSCSLPFHGSQSPDGKSGTKRSLLFHLPPEPVESWVCWTFLLPSFPSPLSPPLPAPRARSGRSFPFPRHGLGDGTAGRDRLEEKDPGRHGGKGRDYKGMGGGGKRGGLRETEEGVIGMRASWSSWRSHHAPRLDRM